MPKPNYHHAKKQKELARKARKQEKEQKKSARATAPEDGTVASVTDAAGAPVETTSGTGT